MEIETSITVPTGNTLPPPLPPCFNVKPADPPIWPVRSDNRKGNQGLTKTQLKEYAPALVETFDREWDETQISLDMAAMFAAAEKEAAKKERERRRGCFGGSHSMRHCGRLLYAVIVVRLSLRSLRD